MRGLCQWQQQKKTLSPIPQLGDSFVPRKHPLGELSQVSPQSWDCNFRGFGDLQRLNNLETCWSQFYIYFHSRGLLHVVSDLLSLKSHRVAHLIPHCRYLLFQKGCYCLAKHSGATEFCFYLYECFHSPRSRITIESRLKPSLAKLLSLNNSEMITSFPDRDFLRTIQWNVRSVINTRRPSRKDFRSTNSISLHLPHFPIENIKSIKTFSRPNNLFPCNTIHASSPNTPTKTHNPLVRNLFSNLNYLPPHLRLSGFKV